MAVDFSCLVWLKFCSDLVYIKHLDVCKLIVELKSFGVGI